MFRLASIDIGTNTVRLLVVEAVSAANYRTICHEQEIVRLGEGFDQHGTLQPQAISRTIAALTRYVQKAAELKTDRICAVATSAVREALNRADFVAKVRSDANLEIQVIPPETEAELALIGVKGVIKYSAWPILVLDIGGGSTEFIQSDNNDIKSFTSLKIGVVKLTERFLKSDPVCPKEYKQLTDYIFGQLEKVKLAPSKDLQLIGNAGTVTTLAAVDQKLIDYDPDLINNYILTKQRILSIQNNFLKQNISQRRSIAGLEPDRADVIAAGAAILLCAMELFGFKQITACDSGLREGIILKELSEHFS